MTYAQGQPLSLRPVPVADRAPKNLADFIARVNTQPGGFRAVTEDKLRDEIKSREMPAAGDSDPEDVDMSDAGVDEDQAKDPNLARMEVLKNIEVASNTAMLTLDSLSLLLSKQSPTQAGLTLSQQLRDMVGIGTLGADRLDEPTTNPNKAADEEQVAIGMTLMHINQARDAAEEAGKFLQKEVEAESKYWEDLVAVKQSGWAICRVPNERHTLAVKFGFSEAATEFKNNGLAPMRRGNDGCVELDLGRLGGVSEGLVVTYEKDGKVVGRSVPRRRADGDASLESRVLEARNTIFSQELWHELTREARTLAAYDVKPEGSKLIYQIDDGSRIALELAPLESSPGPVDPPPDPDDADNKNDMAETVSLSLHILLSHAHRYNELMRIRPLPPHIPRTRGQQVYALLRPVIARLTWLRSVEACTEFVGGLTRALHRAGFPSASFALKTAPFSLANAGTPQSPHQPPGWASQSLIRSTLQPIESTISLTILPETSLTIRTRTFLFPVTTTLYHVVLPPSSVLHRLCAPFPDGYRDARALSEHIRTATARLLARYFADMLSSPTTADAPSSWTQPLHSSSLCHAADPHHEMRFLVAEEPLALVVTSTPPRGGEHPASEASWRWTALQAGSSAGGATMEDVVAREAARLSHGGP